MTHTNEQRSFINAIVANPADDAPRLVYADWLDENGQEDYAEFVRVQIQLSNLGEAEPNNKQIQRLDEVGKLAWRQRELWGKITPISSSANIYLSLGRQVHESHIAPGKCSGLVRRGFIDGVRCTLADWMTQGPEIVREHPITQVAFSNFVLWTPQQGGQQSYFIFDRASFRDDPVGNGVVPTGLFEKLKASKYMSKSGYIASCCSYGASQEALADLSQACIAWAKSGVKTTIV